MSGAPFWYLVGCTVLIFGMVGLYRLVGWWV